MGSGVGQSPSAVVSSHAVLLGLLTLLALALADPQVALPTEPYSYDFPEDVAPALSLSFSHVLGATNPTQKKKSECFEVGVAGDGPG